LAFGCAGLGGNTPRSSPSEGLHNDPNNPTNPKFANPTPQQQQQQQLQQHQQHQQQQLQQIHSQQHQQLHQLQQQQLQQQQLQQQQVNANPFLTGQQQQPMQNFTNPFPVNQPVDQQMQQQLQSTTFNVAGQMTNPLTNPTVSNPFQTAANPTLPFQQQPQQPVMQPVQGATAQQPQQPFTVQQGTNFVQQIAQVCQSQAPELISPNLFHAVFMTAI
jgi:PAX-interacting protein 1